MSNSDFPRRVDSQAKNHRQSRDLTPAEAAGLAAAIARLETLLGSSVGAAAGANSTSLARTDDHSRWLANLLRSDIDALLASPPLSAYCQDSESGEDSLHRAWLLLSRAKADLAAFEERRRFESIRPRTWNETVQSVTQAAGKALVLPIVLGVTVPALSGVASVYYEVDSHKKQQAFDLQKEQLLRISTDLGEIEIVAQELEWSVREAEKQPWTEVRKSRYLVASQRLSRKLQQVTQLVEFPTGSPASEAELRAYYELESLSQCLESAGRGENASTAARSRIHAHIDDQLAQAHISQPVADALKAEADPALPCGENFDSSAFENLSVASARFMWAVLGGEEAKW